ncbi:hypothetical protein Trydic_g18475 [Trypoxylus dichotomus]
MIPPGLSFVQDKNPRHTSMLYQQFFYRKEEEGLGHQSHREFVERTRRKTIYKLEIIQNFGSGGVLCLIASSLYRPSCHLKEFLHGIKFEDHEVIKKATHK